jgi:fluoroacetyl-CoA thioesterase
MLSSTKRGPAEIVLMWNGGLRMTVTSGGSYIQVMPKPVPIGTRGQAETTVQFQNTLTAWKEHLPSVYSTPNMIGMMEAAAYNALEPFCEGDEVSVGTAINVVHRAPAIVGQTVKTEAVLEAFDGRFYTFKVSASSEREVIGYGTIGRAIVSKAGFEEKQRKKERALTTDPA